MVGGYVDSRRPARPSVSPTMEGDETRSELHALTDDERHAEEQRRLRKEIEESQASLKRRRDVETAGKTREERLARKVTRYREELKRLRDFSDQRELYLEKRDRENSMRRMVEDVVALNVRREDLVRLSRALLLRPVRTSRA